MEASQILAYAVLGLVPLGGLVLVLLWCWWAVVAQRNITLRLMELLEKTNRKVLALSDKPPANQLALQQLAEGALESGHATPTLPFERQLAQ